ncbi:hypothetical protein F2Q69_00022815 [Brassica cretica]|uniref:Uncharacterized protein n=1 Tax=Brassica cretica TaxID=69181 RepID=A0A8S9QIE2_BRACR|nr:hypothetical protein F2Q69_00022815 [Brassica cretica]
MQLIKALAEASPLFLSSGSHSTLTLVKDSEPPLQRTLVSTQAVLKFVGCRPMLKASCRSILKTESRLMLQF